MDGSRRQIKQLVQVALISALCVVGRLVFTFIPNVQPMTALILIVNKDWGWRQAALVATLSVIVSNLFLGMGFWTLMQIMTYLLVIVLTTVIFKFISKLPSNYHLSLEALWSGVSGLIYGFIISVMWTQLFQVNHFWAYYLRGLSFDLAHAGGNVIFYLLLAPIIGKLIKRYV